MIHRSPFQTARDLAQVPSLDGEQKLKDERKVNHDWHDALNLHRSISGVGAFKPTVTPRLKADSNESKPDTRLRRPVSTDAGNARENQRTNP